MRLFKIFFRYRLSNFYSLSSTVLFISLLFSSCASTKEGSYAYMDDIYLDSYVNSSFVVTDEYESFDEGASPSNVPGAAYVYQPIPEPTLSQVEEPYVYSPYTSVYDDFYSADNYDQTGYYNTLYGNYLPFGVDVNFLFFNALALFSNNNYAYYPNNYSGSCPSSAINSGSSSSFIAKRFSWDDAPDQIIQYISNVSKNSGSNTNTTNRSSASRKSRFTNSSSSSKTNGGNGFIKFLSTASDIINESSRSEGSSNSSGSSGSRSSGSTKSSSNSSGSAGSSRSGGASKSSSSNSGKRFR